jgi:hypothetical protein
MRDIPEKIPLDSETVKNTVCSSIQVTIQKKYKDMSLSSKIKVVR